MMKASQILQDFLTQHDPRLLFTLPHEKELDKSISVQKQACPHCRELMVYTIKVKSDNLYLKLPWLLELVPRCFSVVYHILPNNSKLVGWMTGPKKFGGLTEHDDDDGDTQNTDLEKIYRAARHGLLTASAADKANGELAGCMFFTASLLLSDGSVTGRKVVGKDETGSPIIDDQIFILAGSKNSHRLLLLDKVPEWVENVGRASKPVHPGQELVNLILLDIYLNRRKIMKMIPPSHSSPTLCGEFLGTGTHFVKVSEEDRNTVSWWALISGLGMALPPDTFYSRATATGVKTVSRRTLLCSKPGTDQTADLHQIIHGGRERCGNGEGSVIYFHIHHRSPPSEVNPPVDFSDGDEPEDVIILSKNKTSWYKVLRFLRQQFMSNGYDCLENLAARFIDAASYHKLSTSKCIETYWLFFRFLVWMGREKGYPKTIFNFLPLSSARGSLNAKGFACVWDEFLTETGSEFSVSLGDLGEFDKFAFLDGVTKKNEEFDLSIEPSRKKVIFFQGVPGIGKTTVAEAIKRTSDDPQKWAIVEQDWFYGCGKTCLSWIMFLLKTSPVQNIIISRCNACPKQYMHFLKPIQVRGHPCYFFNLMGDKPLLSFSFALEGSLHHRQVVGGQVQVGRERIDPEILLGFVPPMFHDFQPHPGSIQVNICDPGFKRTEMDSLESLWKSWKSLQDLETGVSPGSEQISLAHAFASHSSKCSSRRSPETIAKEILFWLKRTGPVRPSFPVIWTGYCLEESATGELLKTALDGFNHLKTIPGSFTSKNLLKALHPDEHFVVHASHVTERFSAGGVDLETCQVRRKKLEITVTHLVRRVADNQIAARVIVHDPHGQVISDDCSHITVLVPRNGKASDSREFVSPDTKQVVEVKGLERPLHFYATACWKTTSRS